MSVQGLVFVIAVLGASVGVCRSLYRVSIGRRGSCIRAMVAVVGLGYGLNHVPATGGTLLTVFGAGAAAALARDAMAARRRLSASLTRWVASAPSTDMRDCRASAARIAPHRRCDRARTARVT